MAKILIADDNKDFCWTLTRKLVKDTSHHVESVHTLKAALEKVSGDDFDVVFLDVMMPDGSGLEVLPRINNSASSPEVIIITGKGEKQGAELAINNGAWDYVQKGASLQTMILPLVRALQYREQKLKRKSVSLKRDGIIGKSRSIQRCLDLVAQAAGMNSNILIQGETGTGKELFARAIHDNSRRRSSKFIVVDCAAIPEKLLENTLFGHEKGAFTGADKSRIGLIREADGGTLFLDEIGELSIELQKSFLRVLQERMFRPIGSNREVTSDFRLVAATNKDLTEQVGKSAFREDLLFRLNTITIDLPSLKDRPEDIPDIARFTIARICDEQRIGSKGYSPEFMDAIISYPWPGNIRELVHTLERAIAMAGPDSILYPNTLSKEIRINYAQQSLPVDIFKAAHIPDEHSDQFPSLEEFRSMNMEKIEKVYLERLFSLTGKDMTQAEQISGLSRSRLYRLIKKYKITR